MQANTRKVKIRRSSKFTLVLLAVLILMMSIMVSRMNDQLTDARLEQSIYARRLSALQQENTRLAEDIANRGNSELIEDIARNDLGLVSPGEKVFRFRN